MVSRTMPIGNVEWFMPDHYSKQPILPLPMAVNPRRLRVDPEKTIFKKKVRQLNASPTKYKYFYHTTAEALVQALGDYNPVYGGLLKKDVEKLVMAALGAIVLNPAHPYYRAGILYGEPYIASRRRVRFRATAAFLGVLDHWNEKYPSFRPFYECYVRDKQRERIYKDCALLTLNVLPERFQKMMALHKQALEK